MHTALTRQTLQGKPDEGFLSSQRLPLAPVLNAYTYGSAFAENEEGQKVALVAGSLADVVIWDRDLFSLPVDQVHTANVRMTILDGRVVFQQKEPSCLSTSLFDTKSDSPALIPKCIRTKPTIRFRKSKLYLR